MFKINFEGCVIVGGRFVSIVNKEKPDPESDIDVLLPGNRSAIEIRKRIINEFTEKFKNTRIDCDAMKTNLIAYGENDYRVGTVKQLFSPVKGYITYYYDMDGNDFVDEPNAEYYHGKELLSNPQFKGITAVYPLYKKVPYHVQLIHCPFGESPETFVDKFDFLHLFGYAKPDGTVWFSSDKVKDAILTKKTELVNPTHSTLVRTIKMYKKGYTFNYDYWKDISSEKIRVTLNNYNIKVPIEKCKIDYLLSVSFKNFYPYKFNHYCSVQYVGKTSCLHHYPVPIETNAVSYEDKDPKYNLYTSINKKSKIDPEETIVV